MGRSRQVHARCRKLAGRASYVLLPPGGRTGRPVAKIAVTIAEYRKPPVCANSASWPKAGWGLLAELASARDRYALIAAEGDRADRLVERLSTDLDLTVVHLGAALADSQGPPSSGQVEAACTDAGVLTDLDVLLWPALGIPILSFLANQARRRAIIAVWPGEIADRRARYSSPGRPDHYDQRLSDVVLLRPRTVRFPDEVPYDIERITP